MTDPINASRARKRIRSVARRPLWMVQVLGVLLLVAGAIATFAFAREAGAGTGPGTSGNTITNAAQAIAPFSPGPFDSGQGIDVVVPPNSVFSAGHQLFILECGAPGGVDPTSTTQCDGETGYGGGTVTVNSDGSVDLTGGSSATGMPYTVFALPDPIDLLEHSSNGAVCGLGTANECVLYIGEGGGSDTGMSQPHFFSQAFQVHTDPTDSGTLHPGDGTPPAASSVSAANSTVTTSSSTVTGDGHDPAVVTVTLKDQSSTPVPGKTVSLTAGSGHATIAPKNPGSDVTDSNGQAVFSVVDSSAESVTLTATDTTDSVTVTQTASVTFQAPTVSPSASTISAVPASVPADGSTPSTVTVTVRDNSVAPGTPVPMPGLTVQLTAQGGSSVITPASPVTDASGQATFTVTDATSEIVTYKATVGTTILTPTASVSFGNAGAVSATKSTVVAASPTAFVPNGPNVTVTLFASDGTTVIPGKSVKLTLSGSATVAGGNTVTTNASGQAVFGIVDSTIETVTVTATDVSDVPNIVLASKPTIKFEAQPPPTISPDLSTVSVSYLNGTSAPADGSTAAILHVTVRNTLDQVVPNIKVTASVTPSTSARVAALGGVTTSNATGLVIFNVLDTTAETVTLTAGVVGGVTFTQTATATFSAGPTNANASTVAASPIQVPADGVTASTVTVTLGDYFKNPIVGHTVTLTPSGGSSVVTPVQSSAGVIPGVSDAKGVAKFAVTDAKNEVVAYTATDTTAQLAVKQLASVTFGTPPPVIPVKADCTAVVSSQKIPANGTTAGTVTVSLRDANGFPVAGKTVSLAPSGGSSVIVGAKVAGSIQAPSAVPAPKAAPSVNATSSSSSTSSTSTSSTVAPLASAAAVTSVSNSNGNAVFTVTDKVPETVTYTADDTTDALSGWTVSVTYTAVVATATTTPTTVAASSTTGATGAGTTGAAGTTDTGSAGSTGATDTSATSPALAFTGAPAALPWIFGIGVLLLALGTIGRVAVAVRRRGQ